MASAADRMASNISLGKFAQATELRKRLWFTLGTLIVFRFLSHVPLPGVDPRALATLYNTTRGGVLDFFNNFSGGALERMSVIALGVMPYITASIVVQLATSLSPQLAAIKKEGESGRKRLNQYTRYGTVFLTAIQGWFIAVGLENWGAAQGISAVIEPGLLFRITCVVSLIGGTMFLMWLGEQITSRGIGNGVSLIIMAGIVSQLPRAVVNLFEGARTGTMNPLLILVMLVLAVGLIAGICFMERAQRRVLIQYPKRQTARGMMQGDKSFLPLKINTSGVIPPIFASSLLLLPITAAQFGQGQGPDWLNAVVAALGRGQPLYLAVYVGLILFFAFFYTAIVFNPQETADNLRKYGGFLPGIRPGAKTAEYIDYVLTRITVVGAVYLAIVCVLPELLISMAKVPFYFGGTSLLIIVVVTMDFMSQVQNYMMSQQYESLLKKASFKSS
jgi:preprotein translocase subunit SecY